MCYDAIQVPISCLQTPKLKRMYKMGKVGVQIGIYQALKLMKAGSLALKSWLGLSKENAVNYCSSAVK